MTDPNVSISQLILTDSNGKALANRFLSHRKPADTLAVLLPGMRYNCDKPLLYYTSLALTAQGSDVLQVWVDYNQPDAASRSQTDQTMQMIGDAQVALQAGIQVNPYKKLILAGKSIGTLVMAFILSQESPLEISATIWLTPLLQIPFVSEAIQKTSMPAVVAGGTADPTFDPAVSSILAGLPHISLLCIEGANHSLEIPDDPRRSLTALSYLVDSIFNLTI